MFEASNFVFGVIADIASGKSYSREFKQSLLSIMGTDEFKMDIEILWESDPKLMSALRDKFMEATRIAEILEGQKKVEKRV